MTTPDVVVVGSGIAGTATAIHLVRAGLRVFCIAPEERERAPVGESLDWSAPDLLHAVGLPMDYLLKNGMATYKKHVVLRLKDGSSRDYVPGEWLARAPFHVRLETLHIDRSQVDESLQRVALECGVRLMRGQVVNVESQGERVEAVVTSEGERVCAQWFVDASGGEARVLPRHFALPSREYGPPKAAMWDYFSVPESIEGTTLHGDTPQGGYMEWVLQIPVQEKLLSVGYVSPGHALKAKRQQGLSISEIFRERLAEVTSLASAEAEAASPRVRSFRCRVHSRTAGANWVVVGEAAAMVDPMTSNGVTAALRGAEEASLLILQSRGRHRFSRVAAALYSLRIRSLAAFFNEGIERVMYDWPVRSRIGALAAGDVYTVPAWIMNLVYSRLQPRGPFKTLLFVAGLGLIRAALKLFYGYCKLSAGFDEDVPASSGAEPCM